MSYLVLARKYRPKNFESVVGQDHVVRALSHALESGRLHQAYLFTGTRGIGKTTLSRILAKSLNCEKGVTPHPCGECEACTAIDSDRFVDYVEMDAASNRGVSDMEQLLEQAAYPPVAARFKIYMIDEVHMLTGHAFNAMLKTLEEPPPYVKFVLATTDPQKIPATVLSRCLQFNLKMLSPDLIAEQLGRILSAESIPFEEDSLPLLARGARGSMRDALSLTDQAVSYAGGNVTKDAVRDMLGMLDRTYLIRILDCLLARNGVELLKITDEIASRGLSYDGAMQELGALLHKIAVCRSVPGYLPQDLPEFGDIKRFAAAFAPEEVQLYYQIVLQGRNDLGLAPDEYTGFSMTLLRMLAFAPAEPGKTAALPATPQENSRKAPVPQSPPVSKAETRTSQPLFESRPFPSPARPAGQYGKMAEREDTVSAPQETAESFAGTKKVPEPRGVPDWNGDWPSLATRLQAMSPMAKRLAEETGLVDWKKSEAGLELFLQTDKTTLISKRNIDQLTAALENHFGCFVKVNVRKGEAAVTARKNDDGAKAEKQRQAEESIKNDPYIRGLNEAFGGHVIDGSVKPH